MEEHVTIAEGARRLGITTKRIQRAIKAGDLVARYPHPNKAEVLITDLQAWYGSLYVRPGEMQGKLEALEREVAASVDRWIKTRAAMDSMAVLQESLRFEVITQLGRFSQEIKDLTARVEVLETLAGPKKVRQPPAELKLPDDHVWLSDFADLHYIPRNEAQRLYDIHAIHGQPISKSAKGRKYIAIGSKGRYDFWVQLHTHMDFRSCDDCPHIEQDQPAKALESER